MTNGERRYRLSWIDRPLAAGRDAVAVRAFALGHDLDEARAVEDEGRVVVGRVPRSQLAFAHEPRVRRSPLRFAVEVRAERAREEAEPVAERAQPRAERVGHRVLEPAVRARAPAGEDGAALPGLAERDVDAVHAPDDEHVRGVAAADVDHVLARDLLRGILRHAEELEMGRLARAAPKRVVERVEVFGLVRRGGADVADARPLDARERQHEVLERRAAQVTAPHGENVPGHGSKYPRAPARGARPIVREGRGRSERRLTLEPSLADGSSATIPQLFVHNEGCGPHGCVRWTDGAPAARSSFASPQVRLRTGMTAPRRCVWRSALWEDAPPMRYVYDFDEDSGGGRELLGGKGIGLAEMTALGVPVPAGFTITTDACRAYMASGGELPDGLADEVAQHIASLEDKAGKRFGDLDDPLLVSVRSGAAASMPGMMDTILNLGLNDDAVAGLAKATGNPRFAFDSYRRLIQMYGEVVANVEGHRFEQALTDLKAARGAKQDVELSAEDLQGLTETFKKTFADETGAAFPQDARAQLEQAVRAVFDSWNSPRAQVYRRTYRISDELGTAVNVVQMVFGNKGDSSSTGRLLHARPVDRREPALRRVPAERAG